MRLSRIGRDYTYGEADRWIRGLFKESGSHLFAEQNDYKVAASHADVATILHAQAWMNWHRDSKVTPEPILLPGPWRREDSNADVTPERRAELEAELNARSAFPE